MSSHELVELDPSSCPWDRFFMVASLVVVGTREEDGRIDLAPKHMVTPLGHAAYFGFVCTPRHRTYHNARREKAFTVSFPDPEQVVLASLAATPRCEDDVKHTLAALETFPARRVPGAHLRVAHLFLECELDRIVDGFGDFSLIAGRVVTTLVRDESLRGADRDDQEVIRERPLLAYLAPGRFASIAESYSFPFARDLEA